MTDTTELIAILAEAPKPSANERDLCDAVRSVVQRQLPNFTPQQIGEALMHFMPIFNELTDKIHEMDPALDWESIATISANVIAVAGMELYIGKTVA